MSPLINSAQHASLEREKILRTYRAASIGTASPGELVLMLFSQALKDMKEASSAIDSKDFATCHARLTRAQDIINELKGSLNMESGGEVARQLEVLYDFLYYTLVTANLKKDKSLIERAIKVTAVLKDGWEELLSNLSGRPAAKG